VIGRGVEVYIYIPPPHWGSNPYRGLSSHTQVAGLSNTLVKEYHMSTSSTITKRDLIDARMYPRAPRNQFTEPITKSFPNEPSGIVGKVSRRPKVCRRRNVVPMHESREDNRKGSGTVFTIKGGQLVS
jgi:hypothetical protein